MLSLSETLTLFGIVYGPFVFIALFHGVVGLKTTTSKWLDARRASAAPVSHHIPVGEPARVGVAASGA